MNLPARDTCSPIPQLPSRRGFLGSCSATVLGAALSSFSFGEASAVERPPHPVREPSGMRSVIGTWNGGRALPAADDKNPFRDSSTEGILKRLENAEPKQARHLLSILADSRILSDPKLEDLTPYLRHERPEIVCGALEVVAKRPDVRIPAEFVTPFLAHRSAMVRSAAVNVVALRKDIPCDAKYLDTLLKSAPGGRIAGVLHADAILDLVAVRKPVGAEDFLTKRFPGAKGAGIEEKLGAAKDENFGTLSPLEAVRAAGELTSHALTMGAEIRLARRFLRDTVREPDTRSRAIDAGPLLQLVRAVDAAYPGYLDAVAREPKALQALSKELLRDVRQARARERREIQKLLKREVNVVVGVHDDYAPWTARIEERIRGLLSPARIRSCEVLAPPAGEGMIRSQKPEYLEALATALARRDRLTFVWNTGHGGPAHFWFIAGGIGDHLSENLRHEKGVSHLELAETLVKGRRGAVRGAKAELDLSDVIVIQDACFQFDFVTNLHESIFAIAAKDGLEVTGLPRMVSASQRGLPGWLATSFEGQIAPDADKKLPFTLREPGSYLQNSFREIAKAPPKRLLDRILLGDDMLNREIETRLARPDGSFEGQDLAVFSARVVNLDSVLGDIAARLGSRGIALPKLPERRKDLAPSVGRTMLLAGADMPASPRA